MHYCTYKNYHVLRTYHINNCVYIHTTFLCFYYFSSVTKQRRQMKTKLLHQSLISCPHLNQNVQKRRFLLLAEDKMHSKAGKSFFKMGGHYQKSYGFSQRVGCMYTCNLWSHICVCVQKLFWDVPLMCVHAARFWECIV